MKQGKRERAMALSDMKTTAAPCPVCVFACDGCRFKRPGGVCADHAWPVGLQVTDNGPRLCYEKPQTLVEGLALYLLEHEGVKA